MLNRRERILTLTVLIVAGGYALFWIIDRAFLSPLSHQAVQIRNVRLDVATKQKQLQEAFEARARIDEWEQQSLPSEQHMAQSLYQEFLFKLVQESNLEEAVVTAGLMERGKYFTRMPFTVSGTISLENLVDMMYRFYQPKLLHQVRQLTLTRHEKNERNMLKVTLQIQALALDSALPRSQLSPIDGDAPGPLLAALRRESFAVIASKNIFAAPRPQQAAPGRPPELDAARFVYLTGATVSGNGPEAWFYNRLTNENTLVRPGEELNAGGVRGNITSVTSSGVIVEIDKARWSLDLGKNLRELRPVAQPADARPVAQDDAGPSKEPAGAAGNGAEDPASGDPAPPSSRERTEQLGETLPVSQGGQVPVAKADSAPGS